MITKIFELQLFESVYLCFFLTELKLYGNLKNKWAKVTHALNYTDTPPPPILSDSDRRVTVINQMFRAAFRETEKIRLSGRIFYNWTDSIKDLW